MTIKRHEPALTAGEREMLEGWLDRHRATLAWKCEELTEEQLRAAAVPPSELSLLGLVRHLADVERAWFRRVMADDDPGSIFRTPEDRDRAFHVTEADGWKEAYTAWQGEIGAARSIAARFELDDLALGTRGSGDERRYTLRWIYTHMIEEYARHNGHADLLRERIDGRTGE